MIRKSKKYFRNTVINLVFISVLIIIYAHTTAADTIDIEDIDKTKDYMICKYSTCAECDLSVIYDSKGRDIDTVVIKNTLEHIFKFSGVFKNDLHGGLNTFVVYGDTEEIKDRKGAVYLYNYDIKVVYPVKRDSFPLSNNDLPKDRILRYELW